MTRHELDLLVATAREEQRNYMAAIRTNSLDRITKASHAYHQAFDELKNATKWSLTKLFAVVNEREDY